MPASEEDLQAFLKWAADNGAYIHASLRFDAASGRVFATKAIEPGTKLLTCPHELAFDYEKAIKILAPVHKNVKEMAPESAMCWAVMHEMHINGPDSFWMPYFKILPKDFDTPLYFDEEDMMFLQGCNMGPSDIESRKLAWHDEYRAGIELLGFEGMPGITWENYLWVRTVFSSRSFPATMMDWNNGSDLQDKSAPPVLFPVIDSLNHKPKTKISWTPYKDAFGLVIEELVPADQEVFNNYGPKPNEELLMGYGFCLDPNPVDTVILRINVTRDMLSKPQRHIRRRQPQPPIPGIFTIRAFGDSSFDPSLVGLFRILAASQSDLTWFAQNPEAEWVSVRNEVKAHDSLLKGGLTRKLQALKELDIQPKNSKQEAAMIYRKGQMALLGKAVNEAEAEIKRYISETTTATLEDALADPVWAEAVEAVWGSSELEALMEAEMEDIVFMFYIAWRYLTTTDETWRAWFKVMEEEYCDPMVEPEEANEEAEGLMAETFPRAAEVASGVFGIEGFTTGLIGWAMTISEMEQVVTMVDGEKWSGYFLTPPGVKP